MRPQSFGCSTLRGKRRSDSKHTVDQRFVVEKWLGQRSEFFRLLTSLLRANLLMGLEAKRTQRNGAHMSARARSATLILDRLDEMLTNSSKVAARLGHRQLVYLIDMAVLETRLLAVKQVDVAANPKRNGVEELSHCDAETSSFLNQHRSRTLELLDEVIRKIPVTRNPTHESTNSGGDAKATAGGRRQSRC